LNKSILEQRGAKITIPQNQDGMHHRPGPRWEAVLERLMLLGMNVVRLNFAHGTLESHKQDIRRIRAVAEELQGQCLIWIEDESHVDRLEALSMKIIKT